MLKKSIRMICMASSGFLFGKMLSTGDVIYLIAAFHFIILYLLVIDSEKEIK